MYITYEMYRSKNKEYIDTRKISLPIGDFRQLLNLDGLIISVIHNDIKSIPMIKKFGVAYIGDIRCTEIEIIDEDNTDAMNEKQFREYFKEMSDTIKWSKKEEANGGKNDTNQSSEHKTGEGNIETVGNEENE